MQFLLRFYPHNNLLPITYHLQPTTYDLLPTTYNLLLLPNGHKLTSLWTRPKTLTNYFFLPPTT